MRWFSLLLLFFITLSVYAQSADDTPIITPENISQVEQLAHMGQGVIFSVDDSPDGRTLAIATTTGIWLYETQNLDAPPRLLSSHMGSIQYSPDGLYIAVNQWQQMMILDAQNGAILHTQSATGENIIRQVAFTPHTQHLFIAKNDVVHVFDTPFSEQPTIIVPIPEEKQANASIIDIAPSPDGKTLIISTYEGRGYTRVWDVATQTIRHTIENGVDVLQHVEYSPTGDMWLSYATPQQNVSLWDATTHALIRTIELGNYPQSIHFSPDGTQLVISFALETHLFDVQTATVQHIITQPLRYNESVTCTYRADMTSLLCKTVRRIYDNNYSDSYVRLIDPLTNTIQAEFFNPYVLGVDADNRYIITSENDALSLENPLTGDRYETLSTQRPTWLPAYPIGRYRREWWAYTPDMRYIIAEMPERLFGAFPAEFHIWDVASQTQILSIPMMLWRIADITISSDGRWLIIAGTRPWDSGRYDEVQVWDIQTGQMVTSLPLDTHLDVHRVFYTGDELLIVFIETRFLWWNIRRDVKTAMFGGYDEDYIAFNFGADYNPNTHLLAMGAWVGSAGDIVLYNTQTGDLLHILTGHMDNVMDIDFTADGRFIVSAGLDGTVRVWGIP